MRQLSMRLLCIAVPIGLATGVVCGSGPAAAQDVIFAFGNGNCTVTDIDVEAGVPVRLRIVVSANFVNDSTFQVPAKNISVRLPFVLEATVVDVDLGVNDPGSTPFQMVSRPLAGSSGDGCHGEIRST